MDLDLSRKEILEIFRGALPSTVTVIDMPHEEYIASSRHHPFIAEQIRVGIYEDATFGNEFLSVARSYAEDRLIEIDSTLIAQHMKGVPKGLAFGYCALVALHEYHHIQYHFGVVDEAQQVARERECISYLHKHHPATVLLANGAEAASTTIQQVYRRIALRS